MAGTTRHPGPSAGATRHPGPSAKATPHPGPLVEEVKTGSAAETRRLAARLGRLVEPGDVIALVGDLGAGKTTFVTGLAEGLKVPRETRVHSPSFTLINEYQGRLPLYHIDLYRIGEADELDELGLHEYLQGQGVCAVEWLDRFPEVAGGEMLEVQLAITGETRRRLAVVPHGAVAEARARKWLAPKSGPRASGLPGAGRPGRKSEPRASGLRGAGRSGRKKGGAP